MKYHVFRTISIREFLLVTFLSSILLTGCKTQEVQTNWSSAPVKVDGKMDDWANTPMLYFEESGVQLGLRNDSENLYILFRFNNEAWTQAIRMGGLTIWFDNSGKKKKGQGIRYTGGPSLFDSQKMKPSNEGGFEETLTPEQKQRFSDRERPPSSQIIIIDKKNKQERTLPADGTGGPAVSFDSSQGACTYEFSLPLQKSDVSRYGIDAKPGNIFSLGLEWGGVSMLGRKGGGGKPPGGMGGGPPGGMGGGPPGGGMGGGPPGGMGGGPPGGSSGSSDNKTSEKQELWVKTKLALPSAQ